MASAPTLLLLCIGLWLYSLHQRVSGDDGFNLEDAIFDETTLTPPPAKPRNPSGGKNPSDTRDLGFDFDLADALDDNNNGKGGQDDSAHPSTPRSKGNKKPKEAPAKPRNPSGGKNPSDDFDLWDILQTTKPPHKTTKAPKTTKKPPKKDTSDLGFDFDLADALDDNNNGKGGQDDSAHPSTPRSKGNKKPKEGISDKDLEDLLGGGDYSPDKKKSDGPQPSDDQNKGDIPETTIAGIASAVAAALLGTITSYIAYQKKKLCFKVQESLNQAYVKGENVEAGTMSEPQAERNLLETQSVKPPAINANQI